MEASYVQLSIMELLNRSHTELSRCIDRCSINLELHFENRLWSEWLMPPWRLLKKTRKGQVSLTIKVSRGNHDSSITETKIVRFSNISMIHTAEHAGALITVSVHGQFGYADAGHFLTHIG